MWVDEIELIGLFYIEGLDYRVGVNGVEEGEGGEEKKGEEERHDGGGGGGGGV